MKKRELLACIGALMLSFTSCMEDESVSIATRVESKESLAKMEVQNLIQQARNGNAESYKTLAYCYRDGHGVGKSSMNAMFMYSIYCDKTGKDLLIDRQPLWSIYDYFSKKGLLEYNEKEVERLKMIMKN